MVEYKYSYLLGKSSKIDKSDKYTDYVSYIMYLAPSDTSGFNICKDASPGCKYACLFTSGLGKFPKVRQARLNRTLDYIHNRDMFMSRLASEIKSLHSKYGNRLALRLNGTSDIIFTPFIRKMHSLYPEITWYDYTKNPKLAVTALSMPYYNVTFSRSETNEAICKIMLDSGVNVAAVFRDELPDTYLGYPVIDGDHTDARFLDPMGVVVGLSAKGKAKQDITGFVI